MRIDIQIRDIRKNDIAATFVELSGRLQSGKTFDAVATPFQADGRFLIEIDDSVIKEHDPDSLKFTVTLDGQELRVVDVDPPRLSRSLEQMTIFVDIKGASAFPPKQLIYEISGRVTSDDGRPQPGLFVRAFDKGIGKEVLLGEDNPVRTNHTGKFRLKYQKEQLLRPKIGKPNLVVRVFADVNATRFVASSKMIEDAQPRTSVEISIDRRDNAGSSLFERIRLSIDEEGIGEKIAELDEDDIRLLAKSLGLDPGVVSHFVQAHAIASESDTNSNRNVIAEALFGLLQTGELADATEVANIRDFEMLPLIEQALSENWIGGFKPRQAADATRPLRSEFLISGGTAWVSALRTGGATDSEIEAVATAYMRSRESVDQVVAEMSRDGELPKGTADAMHEGFSLFRFAGSNPEFLRGLDNFGIKKPIELARLDDGDWSDTVADFFPEMPDWVEGETKSEQRDYLARHFEQVVEESFPTAVFSERWKRDDRMSNDPVQEYLEEHPEFDFTKGTLKDHYQEIGREPGTTAMRLLARTERLFHISPNFRRFDAVRILWVSGIDSARDVLDRGRGRFILEMIRRKMEESVAHEILQKAQRLDSRERLSLQPVPVSLPDTPHGNDSRPVIASPTIAALFGGQGGNGCDHCLSAFSPSAYLIDLLGFLKKARTDDESKNGLELLFERRPDIANLRMDCKNSHTPLPYVDLVNELLEHIVASASVPFRSPQDGNVEESFGLQTELAANELAAHPEHLNAQAYERLRRPGAPWDLPYNIWADEVRTYLGHIGMNRAQLIQAMRSDSDTMNSAAAMEQLTVNVEDAEILSQPATTSAQRRAFWQTSEPVNELARLSVFLQRTGLSYHEASAVFATGFVNPENHRVLPTEMVDLDTAELNFAFPGPNDLLDRFHRFVRLWRKTDWDTVSLDAVIRSVSTEELNTDGLAAIGKIAEIHDRFHVPVEEIAGWFADLNARGTDVNPSIYQRRFLDRALTSGGSVDLLNEVFALTEDQDDLVVTMNSNSHDKWLARRNPDGTWEYHPDYTPIVLASCEITMEELTAMRPRMPQPQGLISLNLAVLSQVCRISSISRVLGTSVRRCILWTEFRQMTLPLQNGRTASRNSPAATMASLTAIREQLDTGLTSDHFWLAFEGADVDGMIPSDEDISQLVMTMRAAVDETIRALQPDAVSARDKLRRWFEISPVLSNDVNVLMEILEGSDQSQTDHVDTLLFLSPQSRERLFGENRLLEKQERLEIAASDLPVDMMWMNHLQDLLQLDTDLSAVDGAAILAWLATHESSVDATRFKELLPYTSHLELDSASGDERLKLISKALTDQWGRRSVVIERLAAATKLPEKSVEILSNAVFSGRAPLTSFFLQRRFPADDSREMLNLTSGLKRLFQQAILVRDGGLDVPDLEFNTKYAQQIGTYDFANPSMTSWLPTIRLVRLKSYLKNGNSLYDFIADVVDERLTLSSACERLAHLFDVTTEDIQTLIRPAALNVVFPKGFARPDNLNRMFNACRLVHQAGIAADRLLKLTEPSVNGEHADIAKAAVRSHFDGDNWREVSQKLRAGLRERQRDALLSFIRTRAGNDLSHEQVFAHYLIDVDMGACFQTSRTKQAIGSVQQFIQRILLGLEFDGSPAAGRSVSFLREDAGEWKWRRNYRVWEANVKVFVYPENWLEPELRDNKTPFFEELEQQLMQGDLDDDLVKRAVTNYLGRLDEVANPEIVALYDDQAARRVYVVGRTHNCPHQHFLRRWNHEVWSPWARIEAEIDSEHLTLVVYQNQLRLFWPVFTEEVDNQKLENHSITREVATLSDRLTEIDEDIDDLESRKEDLEDLPNNPFWNAARRQVIETIDSQIGEKQAIRRDVELRLQEKEREHEGLKEQLKYQTIELSWISQESSGWTAKKMSSGLLTGPEGATPDEYRFSASLHQSLGLKINVYSSRLYNSHPSVGGGRFVRLDDTLIGFFGLDDRYGDLLAYDIPDVESELEDWQVFESSFYMNSQHIISCRQLFSANQDFPVTIKESGDQLLTSPPSEFMTAVTTSRASSAVRNFFLSDEQRTFFVSTRQKERGLGAAKESLRSFRPAGISRNSMWSNRRENQALRKTTKRLKRRQRSQSQFGTIGQAPFATGRRAVGGQQLQPIRTSHLKYRFQSHYHPYAGTFQRQFRRYGIKGLYAPVREEHPGRDTKDLIRQSARNTSFQFDRDYGRDSTHAEGDPIEVIDFSFGSAYGQYNWELFFHIPMLMAVRLSQNHKFEEARNWFHFVFDPTERGKELQKYWKIKPFHRAQMWGHADDDLDQQLDVVDENEAMNLESMIEQWEDNPFQPHAIARFRIVAYMRMTVMKYLDNLIAWGDSLFRQDSMESINEATQLYVLAHSILGERPLIVDNTQKPHSGFTVQEHLQGHALRPLPEGEMPPQSGEGVKGGGAQGILGVLDDFCLPYNDRMLDYWEKVDDRLFKIRHCMNIDGVTRQLPLFQPPIDPALLVRASAAGVDISAAVSNLSTRRGHYRFSYMMSRTAEFTSQVQNFGAQLLSAMEKRDAEELAQLRSDHEVELLQANRELRKLAISEAEESITGLAAGRRSLELKRDFYRDRKRVNSLETAADVLTYGAVALDIVSTGILALAGGLTNIPDLFVGTAGIASPVAALEPPGGEKLSDAAKTAAGVTKMLANTSRTVSSAIQTNALRQRRNEEWDFIEEQARIDLEQIERQIAAAEIRKAISERELANHEKQIELSEETHAFLKDKFTNRQLYSWMVSQLSTLYFQTYQLAFEMAKQAERCYQHELGDKTANFIQFGNWDTLRKGLLAGERLQLNLKRMESSYLTQNQRDLEVSKSVSLALLDAVALQRLRQSGECYIDLPEALFDLDFPGHYFRRIKTVSLTMPAITGPYTSVSSTLTLLSNRYRHEPVMGSSEAHYTWDACAVESIATSRGQNDSGLFQLNFRDERYLPFEGAGAISSWRLRLTEPVLAQFDYRTISDVILTVTYTARDGGDAYRDQVVAKMKEELTQLVDSRDGLVQCISIREASPNEWLRFAEDPEITGMESLPVDLSIERFPFFVRDRGITIKELRIIAIPRRGSVIAPNALNDAGLMDESGDVVPSEAGGSAPSLAMPNTALTPANGRDAGIYQIRLPNLLRSEVGKTVQDVAVVVGYSADAVSTP